MSRIYEHIQGLITWAGQLAWPSKLMAGALISAVTGTGVLTFLMQAAAYFYAETYGFRPAFEGVLYVVPVVSIAGLFLVAAGILLVVVFNFAFRQLLSSGHGPGVRNEKVYRYFRAMTPRGAALTIVVAATIITVIIDSMTEFAAKNFPAAGTISYVQETMPFWVVGFVVSATMLTIIWRPMLAFIGAAFLTMFYYLIVALTILPSDRYAQFLRATGFGGGLAITLEMRDQAGNPQLIDTYLLMRSSTSLITYDEKLDQIDEFPVAQVWRVSVKPGGLSTLRFRLPRKTGGV